MLGLEVVLADGRVLRTGGRTHKNKTGFDLIGMFVGSEGLLGVVTEATLRLLPLPPARATLSASFRTFRQAANAVQEIFAAGFLPVARWKSPTPSRSPPRASISANASRRAAARICSSISTASPNP